jgi:hypothetical protein
MSFTLTYPHRFCLFRVLLDACPFCFLQYTALSTCCNCSPFLFRVCMRRCSYPTLLWSVPHCSHCWMPSPLEAHWGRWRHTLLLWPACIFRVCVRESPSPASRAQDASPYLLHVFFFLAACLLFSFFFSFFPGHRSVSPGGYTDLSHGVLHAAYLLTWWSPKQGRAGIWQHGSPPGFSI